MIVVEGLPLVPMGPRKTCFPHQVTVVCVRDNTLERLDETQELCRWVFGLHTEDEWPAGDYYEGERYVERAFGTYAELNQCRDYGRYYLIDQDYVMDLGL